MVFTPENQIKVFRGNVIYTGKVGHNLLVGHCGAAIPSLSLPEACLVTTLWLESPICKIEWSPRGILASDFSAGDPRCYWIPLHFPKALGSDTGLQPPLSRCCSGFALVQQEWPLSPRPSHAWLHLLGIRALTTAGRRTIFFPRNIPPRELRVGGKLDPRSLQSPKLREFPSWLSYFLVHKSWELFFSFWVFTWVKRKLLSITHWGGVHTVFFSFLF